MALINTTLSTDAACKKPPPHRRMVFAMFICWYAVPILLLATARFVWGWYSSHRLARQFSLIVTAGEPLQPEQLDSLTVADNVNAATVYDQAMKMVLIKAPRDDLAPLPAEQVLLAQCSNDVDTSFTELVRRARSMPYIDWPVESRTPVGFYDLGPGTKKWCLLADALRLVCLDQHISGDDHTAIETLLDLLHLCRAVDRQPRRAAHIVALSVSSRATLSIEDIVATLSVDECAGRDRLVRPAGRVQVKQLILELLSNDGLISGQVLAFYLERIHLQEVLARRDIKNSGFDLLRPSQLKSAASDWLFAPMRELDVARSLAELSDAIARVRTMDWPATWRHLHDMHSHQTHRASNLKNFTRALSRDAVEPSAYRAVVFHYREITKRRMAAIALAMRLFELDHGRRPQMLNELVPEYVCAIPMDPFTADSSPIGYEHDHPSSLLSIGGGKADTEDGMVADELTRLLLYRLVTWQNTEVSQLRYSLEGRDLESLKSVICSSLHADDNDSNVEDYAGQRKQN